MNRKVSGMKKGCSFCMDRKKFEDRCFYQGSQRRITDAESFGQISPRCVVARSHVCDAFAELPVG